MTFLQIINIIKETALAQPNVNTFVRNFLDLNREDTVYSAVVLQDRDGQRDRISEQDWNTYTFHLGYVDRLTFDESNRDDIFSTGINIINNIVASIRQTWFPDVEVNIIDRFSTFDQRFTASCAGVYVVLSIQVPISDCVDTEQIDIYDKYEVKFTENGHYHYVPDGKPVDEIDITVDVEGGGEKPEETLTETIAVNGSYHYDPTPGYVFSGADISVNVPTEAVLKKWRSSMILDRHTAGLFIEPSDIQRLGADGLNEVEVEFDYHLKNITTTISSNGSYRYEDPDTYYDYADITVDVHPSESLSRRYTTNGSKTITGEFNGGTINVDVHPSESLVQNISTNGSHIFSGEWTDASITVAVPVPTMTSLTETLTSNSTYSYTAPSGQAYDSVLVTVSVPSDMKPETICDEIIQENGSHHYTPPTGEVFNNVHITTDVHPSMSLVETITTNGSHSYSGEWTNAVITVDVSSSKPEETLTQNISANGSYHYNPTPGYVFGSADISVDVHPSQTLIETIAVNGTRTFTGEWNGATITTDVHPSQSLVQSISTNGSHTFTGEWTNAEISVDVHPSTSLSEVFTSNSVYNIQGEYSGGTVTVDVHPSQSLVQNISTNGSHTFTGEWTNASITVAVPIKTEGSLSETILSNGSYNYTPVQGSVYNSVALSVDVHPSQSLVQSISTNGSHTFTGEWTNAEITVAVPTTTTVSMSQSAYDNLSVKDPDTIYLING